MDSVQTAQTVYDTIYMTETASLLYSKGEKSEKFVKIFIRNNPGGGARRGRQKTGRARKWRPFSFHSQPSAS